MIENRLELNTRPNYELPDEVIVGDFRRNGSTPNFQPDLCFGCFGAGCIGKFHKPKEVSQQFWVKTDNQQLLNFIKSYNWRNRIITTTNRRISLVSFKKIILEEFYGVKTK